MSGQGGAEAGAGLETAFPSRLHDDARRAFDVLPVPTHPPLGQFRVRVPEETVEIPYRIYSADPAPERFVGVSPVQRMIVDCLYTRHHDGRVRQRALAGILDASEGWVTPFVVKLVGEYVIEIVDDIAASLDGLPDRDSARRRSYQQFVHANPGFIELTHAQATSYWSCYYRAQFPRRAARPNWFDYPGFKAIAALRALE